MCVCMYNLPGYPGAWRAGAEEPLWSSDTIGFKGLGDHSGSGLQDGSAGAWIRGMSWSYALMKALNDC